MSFEFPMVATRQRGEPNGSGISRSPILDRVLATAPGARGTHRDDASTWSSDWFWNPDGERVGARLCRQALDIWRGLPVESAWPAPPASGFDIGAFWSLIGHLDLMEPLGDPLGDPLEGGDLDFRYRVQGTEVARAMGAEMTGRRLSDAPLDGPVMDFVQASLAAAARRGHPLFTRHVVESDTGANVWSRLVLPFLDDGGAVSRVLVASSVKQRDAETLTDNRWSA
jgi:hypothetical protein